MRPLSPVEVLDAAWLAVRRQWATLYAVSTLGTAPLALGSVLYFVWLGRLVEGTEPTEFYRGTLVWAVGMALAWALNGVARGAVSLLVRAQALGEEPHPGEAWRRARRAWAGCAFVALLCFALGWLGTALVVPGVLLAARWWVARPALLLEDRPFGAALARSAQLTGEHRARPFHLWLLFLLVWLIGFWNLHLAVGGVLTWAAGLLGVDTTGLRPYLTLDNQAYVTFLLGLVFVLLDPVKCAADTFLYLDLRTRREGGDLQERLRRLGACAALLLLLIAPAPARAAGDDLEAYRDALRALRNSVRRAESPEEVPPNRTRAVRSRVVRGADGRRLTVENDWLSRGARWADADEKNALLDRLEALERSLGPTGDAPAPAAAVDPREALKDILAAPEFQPLAERAELRELAKRVDLSQSRNWWQAFWDWVRRTFSPNPRPQPGPDLRPGADLSGLWEAFKWITIGAAVLLVGVILALLVRWFLERGREHGPAVAAAGAAPPLEASATDNALDHGVDDWERFARQWLDRGEIRQAIRALYLATLVHLHHERRIEYHRAFTNWMYVRGFRGEAADRGILERLTRVFDDVWYGERPCGDDQYRAFEAGVRALGTPAPSAGAPGG